MSCVEQLQQALGCCLPKPAVVDVKLTRPPPIPEAVSAPAPAPAPATEAAPAPVPAPAPAAPEPTPEPVPEPPTAAMMAPEALSSMQPAEVIDVMKNEAYAADAELMGAACKQLRVLCRQDENCQMCDSLGAAALIHAAMTTHLPVPAVQQQACAALINLCAGDNFDRRDNAAKSGALTSVVAAMEKHLDYPGIQEMAFVAIQNICFGKDANGAERKEKAVEVGALTAIVNAIKKYEDTSSVIDQGAATLRLLTGNSQLLKAKAMEVGAKGAWLKSSGGISARMGGFTSRMFGGSK